MLKKWQKLIQQLCPIHMHILIPWGKHMQSFKTIGKKLYEELRSQEIPSVYIIRWKMTKLTMLKKWQKLIQQLCPIHMHILIPWGKHMKRFKAIGTKL